MTETKAPTKRKRRWLRWVGGVFAVLVLAIGVLAWRLMHVEAVRIDDHLHLLTGGGGNTLVLASDEGALVVDTKLGPPARTTANMIRELTGRPVKMVINTHYHVDHSHGNIRYPGAELVGQRRTRDHQLGIDGKFFGPGRDGDGFAVKSLVDESKTFPFGDDFVEVRYLGRGHTDGDVVVFLHKRSVLHTGDLFVNGYYPYIDTNGGGSIRELVVTVEKIRGYGAAKLIPGHGPIGGPPDLANYADFLHALLEHMDKAVRDGKDVDHACDGFDAARFHLSPIPTVSSLAKCCKVAWEETRAAIAAEKQPAK